MYLYLPSEITLTAFFMSSYTRTILLKEFVKYSRKICLCVTVYNNHMIILDNEFTLYFYLENRVIFHSRLTQKNYDFELFSINQLIILCSHFQVSSKFNRLDKPFDYSKWLYYKPLPQQFTTSNKNLKSIQYVFT